MCVCEGASDDKGSSTEFQESVAKALLHNQHLSEAYAAATTKNRDGNGPSDCIKHPKYKSNMCKFCFKRRAVYICLVCSIPGRSTLRKETGKKGNQKWTDLGYMHFYKSDCFMQHGCGKQAKRRQRNSLNKGRFQALVSPFCLALECCIILC